MVFIQDQSGMHSRVLVNSEFFLWLKLFLGIIVILHMPPFSTDMQVCLMGRSVQCNQHSLYVCHRHLGQC